MLIADDRAPCRPVRSAAATSSSPAPRFYSAKEARASSSTLPTRISAKRRRVDAEDDDYRDHKAAKARWEAKAARLDVRERRLRILKLTRELKMPDNYTCSDEEDDVVVD